MSTTQVSLPLNQDAEPVQIEIIGRIGINPAAPGPQVDPARVRAEIKSTPPGTAIEVNLHSPGGSVFDSYLIYNSLLAHDGPVSVTILGVAGSAASWIPLAADEGGISMHETGQWLAHESRAGIFHTAEGMEKHARILRSLDAQQATLYANRSGMSPDDAVEMMKKDEFITATAAHVLGLVDNLIEGPVAAVRVDLSALGHVPDAVAEAFGLTKANPDPEPIDPIVALLIGPPEGRPQDLTADQLTVPPPDILAEAGAAIINFQGATS